MVSNSREATVAVLRAAGVLVAGATAGAALAEVMEGVRAAAAKVAEVQVVTKVGASS